MVSEYVGTRLEKFTAQRLLRIREEARGAEVRTSDTARAIPDATIYIAGPFFNTADQWLVDEARHALRDIGFKVFSPIHDVGKGPPNTVAPADLFALQNSTLVFALLSGLDPGTIFEVGYARALKYSGRGCRRINRLEAVDDAVRVWARKL